MHAARYLQPSAATRPDRTILVGGALMLVALVVGVIAFLYTSGAFDSYDNLYLVPWLLGLAGVMAVPMGYLYSNGRFTFVDPLVFATLSYLFPAFVVGGLFFALGISQPSFSNLVQDPTTTFPLTIALIALGYAGLSVGYLLPVTAKIGHRIAEFLPKADYSPDSHITPGSLLLLAGVFNTLFALILGRFGYQRVADFASWDGLIYFTTLFWVQASFLLWYVVFRRRKWDLIAGVLVAVLTAASLIKFLFSGSRGNIIQFFLLVSFAFILSGRRFTVKQGTIAGLLLTIGLTIGMIYGTTFRNTKGSEESQSADVYAETVIQAVSQVGNSDVIDTLQFGAATFAERIDMLSTLAVVVSNHEQLAPYEEIYGLDNNIYIEMTTFMIPRVIWPDRPVVSDPRKYSDLYFDYGESSYAITPIGDLLRNFGIPGVFLGMFVLGLILRLIYSTLVEGKPPVVWRLTLFFMLITSISYEGFYGTIIPVMFKTGFTAMIGIVFVAFIAKRIHAGRQRMLTSGNSSAAGLPAIVRLR